jgi:multidrug efflux pump subunit AcrA (membrane-fusion protein)
MSAVPPDAPAACGRPSVGRERRRWPRRLLLVLASLVLIAVLALGGAVYMGYVPLPYNPFTRPQSNGVAENRASTSLATVARQDLSSQTQTSGTLGYAGDFTVVNQAQGVVTALPSAGQVVSQGQALYDVGGSPVVLLYGSTPAYRSLSEGVTAASVTGPDVQELNADLVALGYVTSPELSPGSDQFAAWTTYGVERLQAALGLRQTGTLTLGQAVFLPGAVRVTSVRGTLGGLAEPGQPILQASSTTRQVRVSLNASQQSELGVGDNVEVSLPNGKSTPGTVTSVGSVATAGSNGASPTVLVLITPTDPSATGSLDQAPVNVTITTQRVKDVLVVPVAALLARAGGTYAVEVVGGARHHLEPVSLGLFDDADGLVQVSGTGLKAGQRVVVPSA